ncbi:MAG: phosphate signaling complex protein PhoU [Isosphaeraceae bacterium]
MESRTGGGSPRDKSTGGRDAGETRGHVQREQDALWREVIGLADYVEAALRTAIEALCEGRPELYAEVRAEEEEIDRWEVRIERQCLRVLALYDLVASDLRQVVVGLRINRDLEGLADLAENIAKRVKKIGKDPLAKSFAADLQSLAEEALGLVSQSLLALRTTDVTLARRVIEADRAVDKHRMAILEQLKMAIRATPERLNTWLRLINTARNLERAADHATNIAEAIIYIKDGVNVRRGQDDPIVD